MAGRSLNGRRRGPLPEELRAEEVPEIVKREGLLNPDALLSSLKGLENSKLAPLCARIRPSDEATLWSRILEDCSKLLRNGYLSFVA